MSPLLSFAALADVQHADKPVARYDGGVQYYRSARRKAHEAVQYFNSRKAELACVITLGDIIDGQPDLAASQADLENAVAPFDKLELPAHHTIGNHCLAVGRTALTQRLGVPEHGYYRKRLAAGWSLVVLDTTELSTHSKYAEDSAQMKEARAYLEAHDGEENMLPYNGGVTESQLAWFRGVLSELDHAGERCFVACHHPFGTGAGRQTRHAWNDAALEEAATSSKCVAAVFSGHDHWGGYACVHGVHHIVLEAMLESPEDANAFAVVDVHQDYFSITGFGSVTSRRCVLRALA